jgi:hypothetical protein
MVNCKNTKSLGDHKNYIGGNATIDSTVRSNVYLTISTRFGKLTQALELKKEKNIYGGWIKRF